MMRTALLTLLLLVLIACKQTTEENPQTTTPADMQATTTMDERTFDDPFGEDAEFIIYYAHQRFDGLIPVRVQLLQAQSVEARIKQVIDLLTIKPQDPDAETLWPPTTHIREVYLTEPNMVVIDFHGGFIANFAAGTTYEEQMIYSLVNSILTNFEELDQVFLLIDGSTSETLLGSVDIESPLSFNETVDTVIPDDFDAESRILVESLEETGGEP